MLGYVLPLKSELKLREYEIYSGYYCGICKYIGREYGQLPRMSLSYDAAFLALILAGVDGTEDSPTSEHCAIHHIKYKTIIRNKAIEYSGDVMLILAWFKLLDDIRDEGRIYAKATVALLRRHYRKLRKKHPSLCELIRKNIDELSELEKAGCDSIDRVAEPFAALMGDIFGEGCTFLYGDQPDLRETFTKIGYHMGKWIYLIDAVDDVEENLKDGAYNPLLYRFDYDEDRESVDGFRNRIEEDIRFNLVHYLAVTSEALRDLDIKKNSAIIENIVYLGLNRRTDEVISRIDPPKRRMFGPAVQWTDPDSNPRNEQDRQGE